MKNSPMYQPGAIGFTVAAGVPKVGQLQNAAWALSDTCTFKLITAQGVPPEVRRESVPSTSGLSEYFWLFEIFLLKIIVCFLTRRSISKLAALKLILCFFYQMQIIIHILANIFLHVRFSKCYASYQFYVFNLVLQNKKFRQIFH